MHKRFLPTIIALVVFLVLFAYVNIYESHEIAAPGTDLPVDLAKIPLDTVRAVTWNVNKNPRTMPEQGSTGTWDKEIRVEAGKDGSKTLFNLVKPKVLRGESSEIEGFLRNFEDFRSERVIVQNATDTAFYGIGTESGKLTIEVGSQTYAFILGEASPVGGMVYLQKVGDPAIYLVRNSVAAAFNKQVNDLRAKTIFFEDFSGISSVTLQIPSGTFQLEQDQAAQWHVISPEAIPAEPGEVTGIISGLPSLRVGKFVTDEPAATDTYGFDKPRYRVLLCDNKGKKYELLAGKEEGSEVYIKRADQPNVYSVHKNSLGFLEKDMNRLRTKEFPKMPRATVNKVTVKTATDTYVVESASNAWTIGGKPLDAVMVTNLIDAYNSARAVSFHPWSEREKERLKEPEKCARFELSGASGTREIVFGNGDGNNISVFLAGKEEIAKVPLALFNNWQNLREAIENLAKPQPGTTITVPGNNPANTPGQASGAAQPIIAPDAAPGMNPPAVLPITASGPSLPPGPGPGFPMKLEPPTASDIQQLIKNATGPTVIWGSNSVKVIPDGMTGSMPGAVFIAPPQPPSPEPQK